ncbi:uncharacterized protein LTR77_010065 [Saxophila tyrrhenica]|uniref:Pre-mRNA-splicing factor 38B n=1 Tax=Saxophila tyrrhenica TaxID=1690608 RepID=A0AAV9NWR5_9PEZI|nr:hypothetical protein LTR77_010065 [Saxophila tyrrhenica]
MPAGEALDDDYVISLLGRDAEANKKRYTTSSSLLPSTRPRNANAPKPNTRFLKNLVRDTDRHNSALKAKEEEDARERLRGLRKDAGVKRIREDDHEERGGREGRGGKRRKGERAGRWAGVLNGLGERNGRKDGRRAEARAAEKNEERPQRRQRSREDRDEGERRLRHDRRRTGDEKRRYTDRKGKQRRRSTSSDSARSRSPRRQHNSREGDRLGQQKDYDSDPLQDIIGPKPAPKIRPRGRGANNPISSIDARFNPSYNPKTDVELSDNDRQRDDWDMALEALRDRAKWRVQGGERLRAAGFSEEEVGKWEKSSGLLGQRDEGGEKGVEDMRWRKKGEGREWDRGKVADGKGRVDVKAAWARLKLD